MHQSLNQTAIQQELERTVFSFEHYLPNCSDFSSNNSEFFFSWMAVLFSFFVVVILTVKKKLVYLDIKANFLAGFLKVTCNTYISVLMKCSKFCIYHNDKIDFFFFFLECTMTVWILTIIWTWTWTWTWACTWTWNMATFSLQKRLNRFVNVWKKNLESKVLLLYNEFYSESFAV